MKQVLDKPAPSASINLANLFFWQLSGVVIGGLTPFAALAFVPYAVPDPNTMGIWVTIATFSAIFLAATGGALGTIIGISDKTRAFALKQGAPGMKRN